MLGTIIGEIKIQFHNGREIMLIERKGDVLILAARKRLDTNTAPQAEQLISDNIGDGSVKLIFDLEQVEYISSAGVRVLLKTAKQLKQSGGQMALCNLNDHVQEVMDLSGLTPIFNCCKSLDEALAAVS